MTRALVAETGLSDSPTTDLVKTADLCVCIAKDLLLELVAVDGLQLVDLIATPIKRGTDASYVRLPRPNVRHAAVCLTKTADHVKTADSAKTADPVKNRSPKTADPMNTADHV